MKRAKKKKKKPKRKVKRLKMSLNGKKRKPKDKKQSPKRIEQDPKRNRNEPKGKRKRAQRKEKVFKVDTMAADIRQWRQKFPNKIIVAGMMVCLLFKETNFLFLFFLQVSTDWKD